MMNKWQLIETAPKDGTVVDLWIPNFGRYPDAVWDLIGGEEVWGWTDSKSHGALDEYYGAPTHWMLPPAPPVAAAVNDERY